MLQAVLFIAFFWVAVFGGLGALIARQRGGSWLTGFLLSASPLGPAGWVVTWVVTRRLKEVSFDEFRGHPPLGEGTGGAGEDGGADELASL